MLLRLWQFLSPRTCFLFSWWVLGPREWLLCHDGWHLEGLLPFKCGCSRSLQSSGYGYLSGFELVFSIGLAYPTSECCRFPPIHLSICFETSCMVSTIFCPSWNRPGCDRVVKINSKKVSKICHWKQNYKTSFFSVSKENTMLWPLQLCPKGNVMFFNRHSPLCTTFMLALSKRFYPYWFYVPYKTANN